ncbi:hypothetical protein NB311A_05043 [Nitrobacter sp. Nb-311A]|uniref:phage head-tail joining protein n=1 Tax=Nitrobacter sp. Nb-311A TaxID=314253 RepID=UPI00006870AE|nr:hypothetical protein [Nitrobacter sp. Nb-311A]EAQ35755.1 hypothetical protein NB311A_05043 [Nitrobacter sp. Nb-311A]
MSVDVLQAQLETLRKARASGVRRVEVRSADSTQIAEYKSDAEMAAAISDLERRIAAMTNTRVRTFMPFTSKGL